MKGFYIEVSNNLLDPRHCKSMGDSVWLFMWFIDKMTTINATNGKVLGGKPVKYSDIATDLGISRSTYNRWLNNLKKGGYVQTLRTPYGNCIVVLKAKKRFNKPVRDESNMTHLITCSKCDTSHAPDMTHQCATSDTSLSKRCSDNDTSNKTRAEEDIDIAVDKIKNANVSKTKRTAKFSDDSFTILADTGNDREDIKPTDGKKETTPTPLPLPPAESPVESPSQVNDAIALFLPLFPGDFIGKSTAFARPPTRAAVEALLKRLGLDGIKELIHKYEAGKSDKFRPEAGTVHEFCTFKLAKIESYVGKSAGGLWAQRSISTPEQSKVRDEQYRKVIDAAKERTRLAKEKWDNEHKNG